MLLENEIDLVKTVEVDYEWKAQVGNPNVYFLFFIFYLYSNGVWFAEKLCIIIFSYSNGVWFSERLHTLCRIMFQTIWR